MLLTEEQVDFILQEGGVGNILFEGETPSGFTGYTLSDQLQEHFRTDNQDMVELLNAVQEIFHQTAVENAKKLPELKNPDKVPIELIGGLEEMLNFNVPQIFKQTEESRRRQLKRAVDWIKIKGREIAVRSYLNSIGFIGETEVMVSDDYTDFTPTSDALKKFGTIPDDFFYTPHVRLTFSNQELIDGEILTKEIFDIIKERVLQLSPATAVYDWTFQIHGNADEDKGLVERNFVKGSTSDTYQSFDAEPYHKNHLAGDGIQALRDFEYMDVEFWDEWKIGTYTGDVIDFNSFDSVLKSSTDLTITPRPDIDETQVKVTIGDNPSGSYNAIAFYHGGNIRALFKFPEISTFNPSDTDVEFVAHIRKASPKWHHTEGIESSSQRRLNDQSPDNFLYVTDEYDFVWDRDGIEANWSFHFNRDLDFNDTGKRSFSTILTQDGYFKLGTLSGQQNNPDELHIQEGSDGQPEMHDPVTSKISDFNFEINNFDGFDRVRLIADMIHSEMFDKDIQQIGFFDENDHLIIVGQLDDPINYSNQFHRDKFRMVLEVR